MDAVSCRAVSRMERKLNLSLTAGIFCGWVGFFALIASPLAYPQQYPLRPVRIIVPTAPGGGADLVGRVLAQKLTRTFGQSFVVDNRGGAGTTLGTDLAAKSPADGHTLVLEHVSLAFNVSYYRHLPYDTRRDFAPIALVASQPYIVVVHPSLPVKSVAELIAYARATPTAVSAATLGSATTQHLAAALFNSMAKTDILLVPYKGSAPGMNDLLAGQVQLMFNAMPSTLAHFKGGQLRALGITSLKRSPLAPEVPTVAETLPGFEISTWYGVLAPVGTPESVIQKLNQEIVKAAQLPDVRKKLMDMGLDLQLSSSQVFGELLKAETVKWAEVIRVTGVRAD